MKVQIGFAEDTLERLFLNNPKFDSISSALDVFCPFEAVGMERQEIRHGHFLSYIFNPQRPHGFGTDCLRSFMWAAASALSKDGSAAIRPLDVHLMDLDSAVVAREFRSIDLLIQIPTAKVVIAVELKVDASEHSGQLGRYRKVVAKEFPEHAGWRHVFLFVTKRGDAPSNEDGHQWFSLPLDSVSQALEHVAEKGSGHPEALMMLKAYVSMLRRKHLTDARLEKLAKALWQEHREALEFLMERRPDVASEVFSMLLERQGEIAQRFSSETGMTIIPEHSTRTYVRFAIQEWDSLPVMLTGTGWKPSNRIFLFELIRASNGAIRCYFVLGPGSSPGREQLFEAFRDAKADVGGTWALAPKWRQMTSKILMTPNASEDVEEQFEAVVAGASMFMSANLSRYDTAIKKLCALEA